MHTIPPLATRKPTYKAQYLHDPTSYVNSSVPYSEHTDLSTSTCGPHELHGCGPTLLGYSMQPNPLILRGSFFGSYLHQNTGKKCFHLPEKRNFSLGKSVPPRVENKKKNKIKCNVVSTLGGKIIPPREKIGAIARNEVCTIVVSFVCVIRGRTVPTLRVECT